MTQIFNKKSQTMKRKMLRRNIPSQESMLWHVLRNRKINNLKFKRQFSIGRYIVDFYCPALQLVIEIDGDYHNADLIKEYDADRQLLIESLGIYCLRFTNKDISGNLEGVINKIKFITSSPTLLLRKEKGEKIKSFSLSLRRRGTKGEV